MHPVHSLKLVLGLDLRTDTDSHGQDWWPQGGTQVILKFKNNQRKKRRVRKRLQKKKLQDLNMFYQLRNANV